jgi:hypothetical protein
MRRWLQTKVERFIFKIFYRVLWEAQPPSLTYNIRKRLSLNPLLSNGAKYFSQNDEDGILMEILRRIKLTDPGQFLEIGVGDGLENNTLILIATGWSGAWIGGERLAFKAAETRLSFVQEWVTTENVATLARRALSRIEASLEAVSVASVDIDGNDYHIADELLSSGLHPDVFIVEYNAKFPPGVEFVMHYKPEYVWHGGDYFGASLLSWARLFERFGYFLAACNLSGVNAFFVHKRHRNVFDDVPEAIDDLFVEGTMFPLQRSGYPTSASTIEQILNASKVSRT